MKQMIVHCEHNKSQVAIVEDKQVVEYYVEHPQTKQLVGNIYVGRVVNVLPGMQAAFVDIGQGKNAFLYIDDVLHPHLDKQPKVKPSIAELLKPGQTIVVQVMKEPFGGKGARVTTHYSLPGRWLVYMPNADYVGVSRKIESESERTRLKHIGDDLRLPGEGVILRTVAEGETREALENDLKFLREVWDGIVAKNGSPAPSEIHRDLDMMHRLVRDVFTRNMDEIIIDDASKGEELSRLIGIVAPDLHERVKVHRGGTPLYRQYHVQEQLDQAFQQRIRLASGGYIVIDPTEALTVIDVNTGKFIGSTDLEETVFQTNLEAADQIARLLRLRDIGGIIIVDFIDMQTEKHRQQIVDRLEQGMKKDRTKNAVVGWTKLGLLEITRKKVRESVALQR